MIFLVAVLLGVLAGYAVKGRVANLQRLDLRRVWLVVAGLVLQLLIFPLFGDQPLLPYATMPLHIVSYALVLIFLCLNLRVRPLLVVGGGALLNVLVIGVNGGLMPASATALERAGIVSALEHLMTGEAYGNVVLMSETTKLAFLGDVLYLPSWIPFATAFSMGDLLIMAGLVWLIVKGMKPNV